MPDPRLAQLSCLSLSLSAFEEQYPFSGQVWSWLLNQGLFLPWVQGTDVAVWIKSASFRIWPLWQIRGVDSTSPTKGQDGKTCLGRDSSPCSLGLSVEMMPLPSAGYPGRRPQEGSASSAHCPHVPLQRCPQLPKPWCSAPSRASVSQGWGVQLQQSPTARAGNAPAVEDAELPTRVGAAVKQVCDMSRGRSSPCELGLCLTFTRSFWPAHPDPELDHEEPRPVTDLWAWGSVLPKTWKLQGFRSIAPGVDTAMKCTPGLPPGCHRGLSAGLRCQTSTEA